MQRVWHPIGCLSTGVFKAGKFVEEFLVQFSPDEMYLYDMDVTKTGNGERGAGNGERKSGNELSAETSTKIQNGGPKNETSS